MVIALSVSQESERNVYGCIKMSKPLVIRKTLPVCLVRFQAVRVACQLRNMLCRPPGAAPSVGESKSEKM